jgi:hypothetical protein
MRLQPLIGGEQIRNRLPVGFGDVGEVAAERWHQLGKFVPKSGLIDRGNPALKHHDFSVDDRRLDASTRLAENELPGDAVQRLPRNVVQVDDDEVGLHSGPDGADLSLEIHGLRPTQGRRLNRVYRTHPVGFGSLTAANRQNIFIA